MLHLLAAKDRAVQAGHAAQPRERPQGTTPAPAPAATTAAASSLGETGQHVFVLHTLEMGDAVLKGKRRRMMMMMMMRMMMMMMMMMMMRRRKRRIRDKESHVRRCNGVLQVSRRSVILEDK